MDVIGKSPIAVPALILGKLALFGCVLFPVAVKAGIVTAQYVDGFTRTTGIILYLLGLCVILLAIAHLGESVAVGIPDRKTELKTHGLYRFSRNPIYVGGFVMCAGSCLYAIHFANFLLCIIAVAIHLRIVMKEEQFLEVRFGPQWLEYKRRVPRYIGLRNKN